jgi:hypothetical protein
MTHSTPEQRRITWLKEARQKAAQTLRLIKVEGWRFEGGPDSGPLRDVTGERREELERFMAQTKGLEQDEYSRRAADLDDQALLAAYERSRSEGGDTEANMMLAEITRRKLDL